MLIECVRLRVRVCVCVCVCVCGNLVCEGGGWGRIGACMCVVESFNLT